MVGRQSFFAESYRLCIHELKSAGWQCAILGQLVGTTKIQDGCRDPGKLQNVFIFTLHHARNIIFICTRMLWVTRNSMEPFLIMSDNVRVTKIQHGRHFHQRHNLIVFYYINMILFCPFLCFTISGLKRTYFN